MTGGIKHRSSIADIERHYVDEGGHGWDHVVRVHRAAMWMAGRVGADRNTVEAAALLHDIARGKEERGECTCHAKEGVKMARPILASAGFSIDEVENISHCIAVHRFSKSLRAETLEARILQDADRLDALGAIAIARVFSYNGLHRIPIHDEMRAPEETYRGQRTTAINHFYEKILKITPDSFHTIPARQVAGQRYRFVETFLEQFRREWAGEDLREMKLPAHTKTADPTDGYNQSPG